MCHLLVNWENFVGKLSCSFGYPQASASPFQSPHDPSNSVTVYISPTISQHPTPPRHALPAAFSTWTLASVTEHRAEKNKSQYLNYYTLTPHLIPICMPTLIYSSFAVTSNPHDYKQNNSLADQIIQMANHTDRHISYASPNTDSLIFIFIMTINNPPNPHINHLLPLPYLTTETCTLLVLIRQIRRTCLGLNKHGFLLVFERFAHRVKQFNTFKDG